MKEVWVQNCIPKKGDVLCINVLWKEKGHPWNPHTHGGISIGSIMGKVLLQIVLTRHCSMKINSSQCNLAFPLVLGVMTAYMSSNNSKELYIVHLTTAYIHFNRDFLSWSITNPFPSSKSTECMSSIEKLYWFTKSYVEHSKAHLEYNKEEMIYHCLKQVTSLKQKQQFINHLVPQSWCQWTPKNVYHAKTPTNHELNNAIERECILILN